MGKTRKALKRAEKYNKSVVSDHCHKVAKNCVYLDRDSESFKNHWERRNRRKCSSSRTERLQCVKSAATKFRAQNTDGSLTQTQHKTLKDILGCVKYDSIVQNSVKKRKGVDEKQWQKMEKEKMSEIAYARCKRRPRRKRCGYEPISQDGHEECTDLLACTQDAITKKTKIGKVRKLMGCLNYSDFKNDMLKLGIRKKDVAKKTAQLASGL